jgi:hypothetical protein
LHATAGQKIPYGKSNDLKFIFLPHETL